MKLIIPILKPKYEKAADGCFIIRDGKMFFVSDNNIVFIREHFPDTGSTPERLIENTIRYENNYSPKGVATGNGLCYNGRVNDVL
jgi:hypothetical protein